MISEEATFEKFGYYASDLKPKSNKKVIAVCDDCGKIRESTKNTYHALCSSCSYKKRKGKGNPNWKGGMIMQTCEVCGVVFPAKPSTVKNGHDRFCSPKCWGKWLSENRRGENNPSWKGGLVMRICETCGTEFPVKPSVIKSGGGKYCTQLCARQAKVFPKHHTKPELAFEEICEKNDLSFKYTGDGAFWIGKNPAVNPDFVECNGKKIAIEIFGDYWHSSLLNPKLREDRTLYYRQKALKKYGWKLIVFWESDLLRKDAEQFVVSELKKEGAIRRELRSRKD